MTNTKTVSFIGSHEPALDVGEYELTVNQTVTVNGQEKWSSSSVEQTLYVAGDRYLINPEDIHNVFPPKGSFGEHYHIIPHITLKRSTLPWERSANTNEITGEANAPWLWLFAFSEDEVTNGYVSAVQQGTVGQLDTLKLGLQKEVMDEDDTPFSYLTLDRAWLDKNKILPTTNALRLLNNVRSNRAPSGGLIDEEDREWAICMANRLPIRGGKTYVHLLSVESRYNKNGFLFDASENEKVNFISLANWSFNCLDGKDYQWDETSKRKFQGSESTEDEPEKDESQKDESNQAIPANIDKSLIENLTTDLDASSAINEKFFSSTSAFLKALTPVVQESTKLEASSSEFKTLIKYIKKCCLKPNQNFEGLLNGLDIGNLTVFSKSFPKDDDIGDYPIDNYLDKGSVVLPHQLRNGAHVASFYRGPLVNGHNSESNKSLGVDMPIDSSDELLRFDRRLGMLDTSYAAAWQLGRALMINNRTLGMQLYRWKRQHTWQLKQRAQNNPLAIDTSSQTTSTQTEEDIQLSNWFDELGLLEHIPFQYLVPDARLLPEESIRFFEIDPYWITSLMDGSFSVGRTKSSSRQLETQLPDIAKPRYSTITGFLLRSEVVSGWPDLTPDGFSLADENDSNGRASQNTEPTPLTLLRRENLSHDILLCLYEGKLDQLDIYVKADALQYGFDEGTDEEGEIMFYKDIREADGNFSEEPPIVDIPWVNQQPENRLIDIDTLCERISAATDKKDFNAGDFALQMIEGNPKVSFYLKKSSETNALLSGDV
ncbi:MAG: hypothetical protein ACPGYX_06880 [Oceanobacter sp.]